MAGGPGELVPKYMELAWNKALGLSDAADSRTAAAVALIAAAPHTAGPGAVVAPATPSLPTLPALNQADATALYNSTSSDVIDQLAGLYASFLTENFPTDTFVESAAAWVNRALTTGGAGINVVVEGQLWARARDRAIADAARATETLEIDWAGRRFPMPPGALRHGVLVVQRGAQDAIAEASRAQAIEGFKAEVENARVAVERAVSLRTLAVNAAGEYIRALSAGPQIAAGVAGMVVDSQTRFSSSLVDYYRAQISAMEIPVRVATTNVEMQARTNEANLRTQMETLSRRVDAVVASAQMAATQASAALNAVHTQASISGNDSTNTNIEG